MAVTGKKRDMKDYKEGAKSKMSKQAFVTKPENRHPGTHGYSVSSAESQVKKLGN